jgi:hypothetical protein
VITLSIIAGGSASAAAGMTKHLQTQTLDRDQAFAAAYYNRGAGLDEDQVIGVMAARVADGRMDHARAVGWLMDNWIRTPGSDMAQWQAKEAQFAQRLADAAAAPQGGKPPPVQIGVLRPDIHPGVLKGLGLDDGEPLDDTRINALLSGHRADGEPIEGKRYVKAYDREADPVTGERTRMSPVGAFGICPSPDKSISVAFAFGSEVERAMIFRAHIESAREAVAWLATEVGQVRKGAGGADGRVRGEVGWIEFTHHTARRTVATIRDGAVAFAEKSGTPGDPDLHTHFLLPGAVFLPDGTVGALDTQAAAGFRVAADGYYHARMATRLRDDGFAVELDERSGAARMTAIPDNVCRLFSKRNALGEAVARAEAARDGLDWDALSPQRQSELADKATHHFEQKEKGGKDDVADIASWREQAKSIGWEPPLSFMAAERTPDLTREERDRRAYEISLRWLDEALQGRAVLQHWDLQRAAFRGLTATRCDGLEDMKRVTRLMHDEGVSQYGGKTAIRFAQEPGKRHVSVTTNMHIDDEREFVALAKAAAADRSGALTARQIDAAARASGLEFGTEHGKAQLQAMHRLGEGGRFGVAIGAAGSGKSAMLRPLVAAWRERGREVWGASLAWRQADDMVDGGIDRRRVKAFSVLLDGLKDGTIRLGRNAVLAVDELGLLGTRQGLELLRARDRHGFTVIALGDSRQCQSINAGSIIDLSRTALGADQVPEILTTVRQQTEREREIVGLIRDGQPKPALDLKRSDGSAEMVPGGYAQLVTRTAKLYAERLQATGQAPSISTPTNQDAHNIGAAIRAERRAMGLLGPDVRSVNATDGERNYPLPLAVGDHVRLFKSTAARFGNGRGGGTVGRNGTVAEVLALDAAGITLRSMKTGTAGTVAWHDLTGDGGRVRLAYGYSRTIHTNQGATADEHIFALPRGSPSIDGNLGYTANTRHRLRSFVLTSDAAEYAAVKSSRPINDARDVTLDDKWAMVAKALVKAPVKDLASDLAERARTLRSGMVKGFQHGMHAPEQRRLRGQSSSLAAEKGQEIRAARAAVTERAAEIARRIPQYAAEAMRQAQEQVRDFGR